MAVYLGNGSVEVEYVMNHVTGRKRVPRRDEYPMKMRVLFSTIAPKATGEFTEVSRGRWVNAAQFGEWDQCLKTGIGLQILDWKPGAEEMGGHLNIMDRTNMPSGAGRATSPESRLPMVGCVQLKVVRGGDGEIRMPLPREPSSETFDMPFFTNIDGHNPGDYIKIADGIWVSNSYPIPETLLPHVLFAIGNWKVEHWKHLANNPPEYTADLKGSPDAMLAWLRRDGSALATDAADEIERLRAWLLEMYERAARNSWHVYSCVAHDALNGKPAPVRKSP